MQRRKFLRMGVAGLAATAVAACGGESEAPGGATEKLQELIDKTSEEATTAETDLSRPKASGPVVVALPTGGGGFGAAANIALQVEGVIEDIRAEQGPEARVTHSLISFQRQSGTQGFVDALTAARDEGKQLDLVYIRTRSELEALHEAGLVQAVQAAASSDRSFDSEDYIASAIESASIDGQLFGLPIWIRPTMLQYSPKPFDAAGLTPPDDSWDWSTFIENTARLTLRDAGGKATQFGFVVFPVLTPSYMYMWQNGAGVVSADGRRSTVNSPEAVEAVQFMADLVLKHAVAPRLYGDADFSPEITIGSEGLIVDGSLIAMLPRQVGGQFGFSIFRAIFGAGARNRPRFSPPQTTPGAAPQNPGQIFSALPLAPLPKGRVAVNVGESGGMIAVLDGTSDLPGAWAELRTLSGAMEQRGLVPARRASAEDLMKIDSSLDAAGAAALIAAAETARIPAFPKARQVIDILTQVVDQPVLAGEIGAEDALNEADKQIEELLQL